MTKTGPQKFPGASTAYWYQNRWGGDSMESNVICVHTTESIVLPGYSNGSEAPNISVLPKISDKIFKWYQHFDFDTSSRALVNLSGGVQTNTLNVFQMELIGTCDPKHKSTWTSGGKTYKAGVDYIYWPEAPDWCLRALGEFFAWAHQKHGVPLECHVEWVAYPDSYGTRAQNGVRLTFSEWESYKGVLGHEHVPENLHGDPGDMNIPKVLQYAKEIVAGATTPAPTPKPTPKPAPKPAPKEEPFPGSAFFMSGSKPALGKSSPIFTAMGKRLVAKGFGKYYSQGPGPKLGQADVNAYEAYQVSLGYAGAAAKWPPGPTSWAKLDVPNV